MIDNIKKLTAWNDQIAQIIHAIGTENLPQKLFEAIESLIPNIYIIIFSIPRNQQPQHLYDNYPQHINQINTNDWLSGCYLLDPFYLKCFDGSPEGLYHLLELVPEGFLASEYYQLYYSQTQCIDEACFIAHMHTELRISLSIARIKDHDGFNEQELDLFRAISSVVLSVLNAHFLKTKIADNEIQTKLHNQLQTGLNEFGTSILTSREQAIIQLILHGHPSKTISKQLNISFDTVKMHRRNAYAKLNISSQSELFSLVFEALPYIESHPGADPLQIFLSQGSHSRV